jgi:hypothetical protein
MYALRCTLSLLKRLRKPIDDDAADSSTTALGDWFVRPLNVGRHRLLLCTSAPSLLPVIILAKDLGGFPVRLAHALSELLRALRVPTDQVERELRSMNDYRFAKTNDRTVLGSMTDSFEWRTGRSSKARRHPIFLGVSLELAEAPCGPINYERPKDVARALLRRVV